MRHVALLSALILTNTFVAGAQEPQGPTPTPGQIDTKAVDQAHKNTDVVYGTIKNITGGQKIVINVDKGRDKTYNLADKKALVRVADGLVVGDPVKVLETTVKGNRTVDIVRNADADKGQQRSRGAEPKQP